MKINPESWLALLCAPDITPALRTHLLDHFGSAEAICAAPSADLTRANLSRKAILFLHARDSKTLDADLRWLKSDYNHIIPITSPSYPKQLKNIKGAPPVLFVRGKPELLHDPQIAIVGARSPTAYGMEIATEFATILSRKGLLVTSGLAKGIDAQAHRAALKLDAPTVAVTATGLNLCYPPEHRNLSEHIAHCGVLVSEFTYNTPARPWQFPQRNRVISGLSLGVIVVEAGARSGALITARFAGDHGREVFAIPGSIRNPMTKGCHRLIQQGAKLVQSPDEVFAEIAGQIDRKQLDLKIPSPVIGETFGASPSLEKPSLEESYQDLLDKMGYEPVLSDVLVERCGLSVAEISSMLLVLEMENYVSSENGLYTRLK